jgi:hypothetical protein
MAALTRALALPTAPTGAPRIRRTATATTTRALRPTACRTTNTVTSAVASDTDAPYPFTARVSELQNEGAYAVLAAAQALEAAGRDIVHLEIGQPGFPTPPHVTEAGIAAIRGGQTKYSAPAGVPTLKESIARHVSETRGVAVAPGEARGLLRTTS